MIYAHTADELYVNLFIPSQLQWMDQQTEIIQENNFPAESGTRITVNPQGKKKFTLQLRYPEWVEAGSLQVRVNGKAVPAIPKDGYIPVSKRWKKGDKVEVHLPMQIRTEQLPDHSHYYSFLYGPLVLAARTSKEDQTGLFADDSRGGHIAHGRQVPLKNMPLLVGDPDNLASLVTPVKGKPLTFHLSSLYPETYEAGMELIPFSSLHASRYIIYWPQATAEEASRIRLKMEQDEEERLQLDAATVDKVVCGEQQPESDHSIASEKSNAGVFEDTRWREAAGWFSYQLKNDDLKGKYLYVACFNNDRSRNFDILINGERVKTLSLTGGKGMETEVLILPISEESAKKRTITVRFLATPGSRTAKITEVRLLSRYDATP
ncbi:MAG TPA: hypothetical protein DCS09_00870 [Porphyromonadaceae bacterium]|nr:hypothetical protein [Porphyromonadaceae bacterium]